MLKHLLVRHFALIDHLEVDFSDGLTIITGETGAGKSILLGALGHILGQRADSKSVQEGAKKCIIEGAFAIERYALEGFFREHDLDYEAVTTLRREITPAGKSRAFINDTPVSLAQMKALGSQLVDVHSQHQSLRLNRAEFQLSVLDAVGGHHGVLANYKDTYRLWRKASQELEALEEARKTAKRDQDYLQFQLDELSQANLEANDQDDLEAELMQLENTEAIKGNVFGALQGLQHADANALDMLNQCRQLLEQVTRFHPTLPELAQRLQSAVIELEDLGQELERLEGDLAHDPERIALVTERLDLLQRLEKNHLVSAMEELLQLQQELEGQLSDISHLDDRLEALQQKVTQHELALQRKADQLHQKRQQTIPQLEADIQQLLALLGMPHATLQVRLEALDTFSISGFDKISFHFSANPGEPARPLTEVASGGELSRLMLAIKAIVARKTALPTIIFDEIDTGVSGGVAAKVGDILKEMGQSMQVMSITHLPQIAGKGAQHLKVKKVVESGTTRSDIDVLTEEERVEEIARMLSGQQMTDAALRNARELLQA